MASSKVRPYPQKILETPTDPVADSGDKVQGGIPAATRPIGFQLQPRGPALAGYELEPWSQKLLLRCTFCGSYWCRRCGINAYKQLGGLEALPKLHSQWIGPDIIGMQRPSERTLREEGALEAMIRLNVGAIINLQEPGEHPWCGDGLQPSGFTYEPSTLEERGIAFFNFGWEDMMRPSLDMAMDIAQAIDYAVRVSKKRVAVHCHAGYGRTGLAIACYFLYANVFNDAEKAIDFCRKERPGTVQTSNQVAFVRQFSSHLAEVRKAVAGGRKTERPRSIVDKPLTSASPGRATEVVDKAAEAMAAVVSAQQQFLHGRDQRRLAFVPRVVLEACEGLEDALAAATGRAPQLGWVLSCIAGLEVLGMEPSPGSASRVAAVRRGLEQGDWDGFPGSDEPEILGVLLLDWLKALPEPLLSVEAVGSCFKGEKTPSGPAATGMEREDTPGGPSELDRANSGRKRMDNEFTGLSGSALEQEMPVEAGQRRPLRFAEAAAARDVGVEDLLMRMISSHDDTHKRDSGQGQGGPHQTRWESIAVGFDLARSSSLTREPGGALNEPGSKQAKVLLPPPAAIPKATVLPAAPRTGDPAAAAELVSAVRTLSPGASRPTSPLQATGQSNTGVTDQLLLPEIRLLKRQETSQLAEAAGIAVHDSSSGVQTPRRRISADSSARPSVVGSSPTQSDGTLAAQVEQHLAPQKGEADSKKARRAARRQHLLQLQEYIRARSKATCADSGNSEYVDDDPLPNMREQAAARAMWMEFGAAVWLAIDRQHPKAPLTQLLKLSRELLAGDDDSSALVLAHKSCLAEVIAVSARCDSAHSDGSVEFGERGSAASGMGMSAKDLWEAYGIDAWAVLARSEGALVSRALSETFASGAQQWQRRHAMGRVSGSLFAAGSAIRPRSTGSSAAANSKIGVSLEEPQTRYGSLPAGTSPLFVLSLALVLAAGNEPDPRLPDTTTPDWYVLEAVSMLRGNTHPERAVAAALASRVACSAISGPVGLALAGIIATAAAMDKAAGPVSRSRSPWPSMLEGIEARLQVLLTEQGASVEPDLVAELHSHALQFVQAGRKALHQAATAARGEQSRGAELPHSATSPDSLPHTGGESTAGLEVHQLGRFFDEHISSAASRETSGKLQAWSGQGSTLPVRSGDSRLMGSSMESDELLDQNEDEEDSDRTLIGAAGLDATSAHLAIPPWQRRRLDLRCKAMFEWRKPDQLLAGQGSDMAREAQLTTASVLLRLTRAIAAACDATMCLGGNGLGVRGVDALRLGRVAVARIAQTSTGSPQSCLEPFLDALRKSSERRSWVHIRNGAWPWGYVDHKVPQAGSLDAECHFAVGAIARWEVLSRHWRLPASRNYSTAMRRQSVRRWMLIVDDGAAMRGSSPGGSLHHKLGPPMSPIATLTPKGTGLAMRSFHSMTRHESQESQQNAIVDKGRNIGSIGAHKSDAATSRQLGSSLGAKTASTSSYFSSSSSSDMLREAHEHCLSLVHRAIQSAIVELCSRLSAISMDVQTDVAVVARAELIIGIRRLLHKFSRAVLPSSTVAKALKVESSALDSGRPESSLQPASGAGADADADADASQCEHEVALQGTTPQVISNPSRVTEVCAEPERQVQEGSTWFDDQPVLDWVVQCQMLVGKPHVDRSGEQAFSSVPLDGGLAGNTAERMMVLRACGAVDLSGESDQNPPGDSRAGQGSHLGSRSGANSRRSSISRPSPMSSPREGEVLHGGAAAVRVKGRRRRP